MHGRSPRALNPTTRIPDCLKRNRCRRILFVECCAFESAKLRTKYILGEVYCRRLMPSRKLSFAGRRRHQERRSQQSAFMECFSRKPTFLRERCHHLSKLCYRSYTNEVARTQVCYPPRLSRYGCYTRSMMARFMQSPISLFLKEEELYHFGNFTVLDDRLGCP